MIRLSKLCRTAGGLYLFEPRSGWSAERGNYLTYHADGRYWSRFGGKKFVKKLRQPLSSFKGVETLSMMVATILAPTQDDPDETTTTIRAEDVVVELDGNVCLEIILAEEMLDLPNLHERLNSCVYTKAHWKPIVIVEAFQMADNTRSSDRYPTRTEWVEGTNFFIDHTGRI